MKRCVICYGESQHVHHLISGTSGRQFSEKYGLKVPLCAACHNEIHKNAYAMALSKKLGQAIWEKNYYMDLYYQMHPYEDEARDRFREMHGKNYL